MPKKVRIRQEPSNNVLESKFVKRKTQRTTVFTRQTRQKLQRVNTTNQTEIVTPNSLHTHTQQIRQKLRKKFVVKTERKFLQI